MYYKFIIKDYRKDAILPTHDDDDHFNFHLYTQEDFEIEPNSKKLINTWLQFKTPDKCTIIITNKNYQFLRYTFHHFEQDKESSITIENLNQTETYKFKRGDIMAYVNVTTVFVGYIDVYTMYDVNEYKPIKKIIDEDFDKEWTKYKRIRIL